MCPRAACSAAGTCAARSVFALSSKYVWHESTYSNNRLLRPLKMYSSTVLEYGTYHGGTRVLEYCYNIALLQKFNNRARHYMHDDHRQQTLEYLRTGTYVRHTNFNFTINKNTTV